MDILGLDKFFTCQNGIELHSEFSEIYIRIDDDTTIEMLVDAWREIKTFRKKVSKKVLPSLSSKDYQREFLRSFKKRKTGVIRD